MNPESLTLREWYEGTFLPLFHADVRSRTIECMRDTLAIWERVSKNPPLAQIDQFTACAFRTQCPGSAATVSKHCRNLNHLFAKLGPPGPRNRDALGLLSSVPWFKPPRVEHRLRSTPGDTEVAAFVRAAPMPLALFAVVAATTGSRQTAIRLSDLNAVDHNALVMRFPAATDKRGRERVKPIPSLTAAWWRAVADRSWPASRSGFAAAWRRAALEVGTPTLRPHALKRWWGNRLVRAGASPWCVKFALDHAQNDVTGLHYLNSFDELAELVTKIELPTAFSERLQPKLPNGQPQNAS